MAEINIHDCWHWKDSELDMSYFSIMKKEFIGNLSIIHISVYNVVLNGESFSIAHLPIAEKVINRSLRRKVDFKVKRVDEIEFENAYMVWKKSKGGVWQVDLNEIIQLTYETIRP